MPPSFSIVVPTYGRPERLRACLGSLAEIDYDRTRYEIVVVDDGTEPCGAVAEAVGEAGERVRTTLVRQEHAGPATARNRGARATESDLVAFTDDDCRPSPAWLRALAAAWDGDANRVIGGRTVNAVENSICSAATQALVSYMVGKGRATGEAFFPSNNLALSRGLFDRIGGFDARFSLAAGEDRDFCDRCVRAGCDMAYAADAVVRHDHALTFGRFLRQHFHYGRGAYLYREARLERCEGGSRFEKAGYYADLVAYPLRNRSEFRAPFRAAFLLAVAQFANAAGYVAERSRRRVPQG